MAKTSNKIDVIDKLLHACYTANKNNLFIMSLYHQYEERGFLTKKQLQGLLDFAAKHTTVPVALQATVQALVNKMPERNKKETTTFNPTPKALQDYGVLINEILQKHPTHKAILELQTIWKNKQQLSVTQKNNLLKLHKLLLS